MQFLYTSNPDAENAKAIHAPLASFGVSDSHDDLIVSKLAAARSQVLADVDGLRKAEKSQVRQTQGSE